MGCHGTPGIRYFKKDDKMIRRTTTVGVLFLLLLFLLPGVASSQNFRNIASLGFDYYEDQSTKLNLVNVFLAPLGEQALLEARLEREDETKPSVSRTLIALGPIFTWPSGLYTISRYGIGFEQDNDDSFFHELNLEANYEQPGYYYGGGIRSRYFQGDQSWFMIPSLGGKLYLDGGFGILGKYFFGVNSDEVISHSLWLEGDYAITPTVTVNLGATAGREGGDPVEYSDAGEALDVVWSYTVLSGARFSLSETAALKYHLEYLGSSVEPRNGVRNLLLLDVNF